MGPSSLCTPADHFAYWLSKIASPFVVGLGVLGVLGYVAPSTASTPTRYHFVHSLPTTTRSAPNQTS